MELGLELEDDREPEEKIEFSIQMSERGSYSAP